MLQLNCPLTQFLHSTPYRYSQVKISVDHILKKELPLHLIQD